MKLSISRPREGFSLILCLIILTLTAITVVSFLSTTNLDRTTSRAFGNKAVAEAAAQSAVNQAASLLAEKIAKYPDSATVWEKIPSPAGSGGGAGTQDFEGTVLYMTDGPNNPNAVRRVLPLVSRPDANGELLEDVDLANKAKAALGVDAWTNDNSIDLNRPMSNTDIAGWIGAPPDGRRPFRARWIEIKGDALPGKAAPTISRYAFWVEDESFKVNANLLSQQGRDTERAELQRETTTLGSNPALTIWPAERAPFQGLLRSLRSPASVDRDAFASTAWNLRDGWFGKKLPELRTYNQVNQSYPLGDQGKFLTTIYSGGLNLSRHGTQRVNLNAIVGVDATNFDWKSYNPTDKEIQKQLEQIVDVIRYHGNPTTIGPGRAKFGQRFYRKTFDGSGRPTDLNDDEVASAHEGMYLYKLAANIRDYIDPDLQPTIVRPDGTLPLRRAPISAINANYPPVEIMAQGKDSGPFLQEAAVRYHTSISSTKRYTLKVDYYIEFWNMGTQDIYATNQGFNYPHALGNNAFVRIANQQAWLSSPTGALLTADNQPSGDPIQAPQRDLIIDLNNGVFLKGQAVPGVVFKAGACTVVTTDPDYQSTPPSGSSPLFSGGFNKDNIYYCSNLLGSAKREYTGPLPNSKDTGIKPDFRDGNQDYDTEVILGNDRGVIDSHPAAVAMGGNAQVTTVSAANDHWYGGTLLGNSNTRSQLGDPRTNNEQIDFYRFNGSSTSEPDQSRYWNTVASPRFSLGYPNELYVLPHLPNVWPDYYKGWSKTSTGIVSNQPTAANAPAFIANERMRSIGQLGDVFDPARAQGSVGSLGINLSRGGGRTLRVGQKDDLVDMTKWFANSQQWASWRLADFFCVTNDLYQPGLININGVRRDNGAALRAACYGLQLRAVSQAASAANGTVADVPLDSTEGSTSGVQRVIDEAITRLNESNFAKVSYFRERGELSELTLFNSATRDLLTTTNMSDAFDRTREELCRRLMEMITTRGNIFAVYAVGQSVTEDKTEKKAVHVTGEHWVKVTFALLPRQADGSEFRVDPTYDTKNASARTRRFSKPDHYDVQLLQASSL